MSTVCQIEALLSGIIDPNTGQALAGGSVEFYEPGTSTGKNVWTEAAKSNSYTTYTLDNAGAAELWGDGAYDVVLKNSSGSTIYEWDGVYFNRSDFELTTMSTDYSQTVDDDAIVFSSSATAARELTLLDPADWPSKLLYVFNDNATYTLTITPDAGTIDGDASASLVSDANGIMIYTDGSNCFTSGRSAGSITATDGSDRQMVVDEDGLYDNNSGYQNQFAIFGSPIESHMLCSMTLVFEYVSATTIDITVADTSFPSYNGPAQVVGSAIASGGNDNGIYMTSSSTGYITDDILSPSSSDDVQLVEVISCNINYYYTIATSPSNMHLHAYCIGSYPSSTMYFIFYADGTATSIYSTLNTAGGRMSFQITYMCKYAG